MPVTCYGQNVTGLTACLRLEVFPTVCISPLRAKSLSAAASPKSDLWIIVDILLENKAFSID
jgi:hypothetical protein